MDHQFLYWLKCSNKVRVKCLNRPWIGNFEAFFSEKHARLEAIENSVMPGIDKDIPETLYARIPKYERFFRIKTTAAVVAARKCIQTTLRKSIGERYVEFCQTYPNIEKRVANNHIANYLGIPSESLSRIRKNLELTF